MEIFSLLLIIIPMVLLLGLFVLFFVSLIEIVRSDFEPPSEKTVWLLVVLFLNGLGVILYWLIGRKKRVRPI